MNARLLAGLLGLTVLVSPLHAQRAAESASHEMIVSALQQAAGTAGTEPNQEATSPWTLGSSEWSIHM